MGDLCGGGGSSAGRKRGEQRSVLRCVAVWREGRDENNDLCGGVRRWWRLGVKQEMRREEWREGSRGSCECVRVKCFFFF